MILSAVFIQISSCTSKPCAPALEGTCRQEGKSKVDICASGRWQRMAIGPNECINGTLQPYLSQTLSVSPQASSGLNETAGTMHPDYSRLTGEAVCLADGKVPVQHDEFGDASYTRNGKMASVYEASHYGPFRCGGVAPPDQHYVAFWTQFDGDITGSQPQPINCNETISLRNPKTGKTATAKVIDRCASCVGVGFQMADPTVPEEVVNGATIDLSLNLWHFLFGWRAPLGVYDIEYEGRSHLGWLEEPRALGKLTSCQCNRLNC